MEIVPRTPVFSASTGADFPLKPSARAADRQAARKRSAGGLTGGSAGALGTDAKSRNRTEKVDPETGEILSPIVPILRKAQRFSLQSVVRKKLPMSRTNNCLRVRQGGKQIQVHKSLQYGTASYSGLQTCGSVWVCPVCAAKIAERRKAEIVAAMASHKAAGGCVNMLTLTTPHQRSDDLRALLAKQSTALHSFWNDRHVKAILAEMGVIGQIRALEVTHGRLSPRNNGWHPHYHILLFAGSGVDLARFDQAQMTDWQVRFYLRWANACKLAGLGEPSYEHGLKLDDGAKAAQYVSKGMWGVEDEMTKGHTKKALHGETPFDFLRAILADDDDKQATALFLHYAEVFKGKRQIVWSRGLKARFSIGEKNDEELASEKDDFAEVLGAITLEQWRDVLSADFRAELLNAAELGGWPAVLDLLQSIKGQGEKPARVAHIPGGPPILR
jgi:hypothetical protein